MRPPAIIAPEITEAEIVNRWDLATGREERAEKTLAESRLEKGRILVEARKMYPATGRSAGGWGRLLDRLRIDGETARRYMLLAGYVEKAPQSEEVPTYAEAGVVKPNKREADLKKHAIDQRLAAVTDEQREIAYRREADAALPESMAEREQATHELVAFVSEARSKLREITARDIHLTSVTTSPEDFMRAKQMLIDIVNLCLDELAQAGVLDGKEQRRQMRLLDGGIQ